MMIRCRILTVSNPMVTFFADKKYQIGNHTGFPLNEKFGYYIIVGLLTGAVFGLGLGAANGNHLLGIGIGALVATLKR